MTDTPGGYASVTTEDGVTVTSNTETTEQLTENLKPAAPEPEAETEPEAPTDPKLAKAAAKLGQKGGEASAAKRAAERDAKSREGVDGDVGEEEGGTDAGTATDGDGKPLGKPRHDPKARMLEATRQAAEAKRERDRLAARVAELEAAKAAPAKEEPKPKEAAAVEGKPKAEDFGTYEEFVEALADYKADQRLQSFQKNLAQQSHQTSRQQNINKAMGDFFGRMSEAAKADPTFTETTATVVDQFQPSFTMAEGQSLTALNVAADEMLCSEHGPALVLHFRDHPEEIQRIKALRNPSEVQREMAKLEGRLSAAPVATAPKAEVSQARPPVRPVSGAPFTADQEPGEEASYEDHKRYWNRRDRAARR